MKKLLSGAAALLLMASCGGNSSTSQENADTVTPPDTTCVADTSCDSSTVETTEAQKEATAAQDKKEETKTNEVKEDEGSKEYDDLLSQYKKEVDKYKGAVNNVRKGKNVDLFPISKKCRGLESKLNKAKSKLSPAQLKQFKSLQSTFNKHFYMVNG